MVDLVWLEPARADLLAIVEYIAQDNPNAAQQVLDDIRRKATTFESEAFPVVFQDTGSAPFAGASVISLSSFSPIDRLPVSNPHDQHHQNLVAQFADQAIVADPVTP